VKPPARKNCLAVQQPICPPSLRGRTDGKGPELLAVFRTGDDGLGHEQHSRLGGVEERAQHRLSCLKPVLRDIPTWCTASPPRTLPVSGPAPGHNPNTLLGLRDPGWHPGTWRLLAAFCFCCRRVARRNIPSAAHCLRSYGTCLEAVIVAEMSQLNRASPEQRFQTEIGGQVPSWFAPIHRRRR